MNVPEINLTTMNSAQVREAYIEAADTLQARWKQAKVGESYDTTRIEGLDGTTPVECNEEMAAYNKHVIALKTELDVRNAAEDAAKQGAIAQHAQAMPFGGHAGSSPRGRRSRR